MKHDDDAIVQMYDKMHEMAMSADDPSEAVAGRCLKRFYEAFDAFERDEMARGLHHGIIAFGILRAACIITAVTVLSGAKRGCEGNIISVSMEVFEQALKDVLHAQTQIRVEGKNR